MSDNLCRRIHPRLPAERGCDLDAGHEGPHAVFDGCGRPEFYFPRTHWAMYGHDENGDLNWEVCHCWAGENHPIAEENPDVE